MATSLGARSSISKSKNSKELQTALYTACRHQFPPDKLLSQVDLLKLKVMPDDSLEILLQCVQGLIDQNLFRLHSINDRIAWKVIKEEDAEK
jgi:DNA-directed RNA polymerase III subunit RPC6